MGVIEDRWAKFEAEVYSGAPDHVVQHIRQAFYAGASAAFLVICNDPKTLPGIKAELAEVAERYSRGEK